MSERIVYASERYFQSFYEALTTVARERIYIEMIDPPAFEKVANFQKKLIENEGSVYYALAAERVVGWCDLSRSENPRLAHRGNIGMGLLPDFRRRGLGARLLESTLDHAQRTGLEKAELTVYTSNTAAIALYDRLGFEREGLIRKYRKLEGKYFDCFLMGKFL